MQSADSFEAPDALSQIAIELIGLAREHLGPVVTSALLAIVGLVLTIQGARMVAPRSRKHYLRAAASILRGDVPAALRYWARAEGVRHSVEDPVELVEVAADQILKEAATPKHPQGVRTQTRAAAMQLRETAAKLKGVDR